MSASARLATAGNSRAIDLAAVPELPLDVFHREIAAATTRRMRIAALFGAAAAGSDDAVSLYVVLADDAENRLRLARATVRGPAFESLTPRCTQAHMFEREIAEQFGVRPEGHPWLKPVRFTRSRRPDRDAFGRAAGEAPVPGVTDFYRVEGDEVHEVAVGPVHAGVIEPGHFRFQCHGEEVFHLEIALGYQHRGVERAVVGGPDKRTIHYMETLAGDTTIGHATAYCQIVEALGRVQKPARAQSLRGIALELERLANHVGDLGALAGDVGFLPTAAYCGRIRGDFLNMSAVLCGSRFGRGMIRPGGVRFDLEPARVDDLHVRLDAAEKDSNVAIDLLWDATSVMARFEDTGRVPADVCEDLGLVGPAARACGLARDARVDQPMGIYRFTQIPVSTCESGDVFARAYVRRLEIHRSIVFIREQLRALPSGPISIAVPRLDPNRIAVALIEGWRGEICHVGITDESGRLLHYKIVDPSFHNWPALAYALRNQQISDFPLCNKSFNLSYCGHDL